MKISYTTEDFQLYARLLSLAEALVPSLTGTASYRLSNLIERGLLQTSDTTALASSEDANWISEGLSRDENEGQIKYWQDKLGQLLEDGIWMTDVSEVSYPVNLRSVDDRPPFLMIRGNPHIHGSRAVAIVGSRRASNRGRRVAYEIASRLARNDIAVVSGLASGIDTAAHKGALSVGGSTIAVFGTGIELVYPEANRELAGRIAETGACVSQFLASMRGSKGSFPARNRVITGMSLGVVVVEASEASGTRSAINAALRQGRQIFLMNSLVNSQPWTQQLLQYRSVSVIDSPRPVIDFVNSRCPLNEQERSSLP